MILFLGNIITGLFWKAHADRTRDPRVIAHTFEGIIRSDRWFTLPGIVVIVIAGLGGAVVGHVPILRTGWIFWSIALLTLSGLVFGFRVAPLQQKLAAMARAAVDGARFDWDLYRSLSRRWEWWGIFAILTLAAAVVLMVYKPVLPGL